MKIPNKIYLQWHGDQKPDRYTEELPDDSVHSGAVTWCIDKIYPWDIVYFRRKSVPQTKKLKLWDESKDPKYAKQYCERMKREFDKMRTEKP
jgi:hypothetical protein